jgi:hypothetical protein
LFSPRLRRNGAFGRGATAHHIKSSDAEAAGIPSRGGHVTTPALHSVTVQSVNRFDGPERFDRRSFRIIDMALNAPFLRKISGVKYLFSDLLF